ncbi:Uncharacterised protein [uncultured archaeon]|nr:Uncharacterised protein [uncultured archaeon]
MDKIKHLETKYSIAGYELIRSCESAELHLYLYLKLYAINKHEAFPSFRTIQKDLGWSMDKISRTVKRMKHRGHLKVIPDKGKNNVYDITWYDIANQRVLRKPEQGCSGNQSGGALKNRAELIDNITNRNITINIDSDKDKSENQSIVRTSWTKELLKRLEETYGSKLTRRSMGIQLKALLELKDAGYAPEEIWEGLKRMKEDRWWKDKNPDYRNLAQNSLKFMPRRQKAGKYSHLAIKD